MAFLHILSSASVYHWLYSIYWLTDIVYLQNLWGTNMHRFTIKPLTPELNKDYLDFFDNRAFTDGNPNGPCYCTSPNQDEATI